ncbi:hypothetical protein H0H92_007041 [Tricholoma furcatifolium]|nr:hypothetical protein H0H92_007041 [Tricholoma furcatifolium]
MGAMSRNYIVSHFKKWLSTQSLVSPLGDEDVPQLDIDVVPDSQDEEELVIPKDLLDAYAVHPTITRYIQTLHQMLDADKVYIQSLHGILEDLGLQPQ